MNTIIHELRLSHIQFERFDTLIPSDAPLGVMGKPKEYEDQLRQFAKGSQDCLWTLPWKTVGKDWERYQRFWIRYLDGDLLNNVDATKAWRNLVPFRVRAFGRTVNGNCSVEGYFYPHGVAAVINFYIKGIEKTLSQTVELALDALEIDTYDIEWFPRAQTHEVTKDLTTEKISAEALQRLRQIALGPDHQLAGKFVEGLTVVTVIDGVAGDDAKLYRDSDLHRALEVLCTWAGSLDAISPKCPPQSASERRQGDVLYLCQRGKVVWFPDRFQHTENLRRNEKKNAKLNCYHRNLTLATLQTESLLNLLDLVNGAPHPIPQILQTLGQYAADQIAFLHTGNNKTYRSRGPWHQIEAQKQDVNDVLVNRLRLEPLSELRE